MSVFDGLLSGGILDYMLKRGLKRIHFVGVLGAGMLPLAKLCVSLGYKVSGSDARAGEFEIDLGFEVTEHRQGLLTGVELVVVSFAIPTNTPEMLDAKAQNIPIISRSQLLGELMKGYNRRIGISGSHGKSTTTALIDKILYLGGVSPTTVPGAKLFDGCDVRIGEREALVYEACEYRDAFLNFYPSLQVITGIELDHTDYFADIDVLRHSFLLSAERADEAVILNADFDRSDEFAKALSRPCITYGRSQKADYRYVIEEKLDSCYRFCILRRGEVLLEASTTLIGEYNLSNITAAAAVADTLGVDCDTIARAIGEFHGIERRMSRIGRLSESEIFYDYAHHPTEISAAIRAVRERYDACTVVFMPHTYSRTKSLWGEFISALSQSDFTILLDIYPAREQPIENVTSQKLAASIGECAIYTTAQGALSNILLHRFPVVVLMGAGNMDDLIEMIKKSDTFYE